MSISEEQRAQLLALLGKPLSTDEIAEKVGVGKMVVAGFRAALTRTRGRPKAVRTEANKRSTNSAECERRFELGDKTEKWAVTMAKVGIRQAVARAPWPRWQFATFCGPHSGESRGIVDLIAVRKDHGDPPPGLKRGDALRIVLIQVKGGHARMPTDNDGDRLRIVKRLHSARHVILATWKKGEAARFFLLRPKAKMGAVGSEKDWEHVANLNAVFH